MLIVCMVYMVDEGVGIEGYKQRVGEAQAHYEGGRELSCLWVGYSMRRCCLHCAAPSPKSKGDGQNSFTAVMK